MVAVPVDFLCFENWDSPLIPTQRSQQNCSSFLKVKNSRLLQTL